MKSLDGNFCCVEDLFDRARFDHVMAWDDDDMFLVRHGNVFAFSQYIEACALQGSHDPFMRNLRKLRYTVTSTVLSFLSRFRSSTLSR